MEEPDCNYQYLSTFERMKDECYEFIKGPNNKVSIVGFGSYGEVKLAKNTDSDEIVAIKMIHGRNAKEQIDVHHKLNHPNIIKLLNYYYEKQKNTTYMVLEFAENGSLNDKIKFGYGHLPKDKIKRYFRQICKAVQYLHSLKYMHRDIKPENILITKDDHVKLCDFGFAAILEYRSTLCGTHQYMAPEMIQEKPYDYKVDVWALGILLFEMIQGTAPFRGQTGQDVINQMKKAITFSNRFEKQEIDLIKKILRVNADNRPNIAAILDHAYFKDCKEEPKKTKTQASETPTTQQSRTISNASYQKQSTNVNLTKPKVDINEAKKVDKQFKHYVPQGTKSNFMANKGISSTIPTSPSYTSSYQGFQNNSKYISKATTQTVNSQSSSSASYRIPNYSSVSSTQSPVQTPNLYHKTNHPKPINSVTSPTSINQMRSSGPSNNYPTTGWRKP